MHVGADVIPNPSPAAGELFGYVIAANDDWIVVGEPLGNDAGQSAGTVQILDALTGMPVRTLVNPAPDYLDYFGAAVALDGDLVLVVPAPVVRCGERARQRDTRDDQVAHRLRADASPAGLLKNETIWTITHRRRGEEGGHAGGAGLKSPSAATSTVRPHHSSRVIASRSWGLALRTTVRPPSGVSQYAIACDGASPWKTTV